MGKKKTFSSIIVLVVMVFISLSAFTQTLAPSYCNGNDLFQYYKNGYIPGSKRGEGNPIQAGVYMGYILGVYDGMPRETRITNRELTKAYLWYVVGMFLERHPELRHYNGHDVVLEAFREVSLIK